MKARTLRHMAVVGTALVAAGCLFGLAGTQVLEVGRTGARIPVRTGEVVTLRYTQSMYGTPVVERLRVEDGRLVLFEVAASDACLEYLRIETHGPGNAAVALDRFTVPLDSVGGHVLAVGGRELDGLYRSIVETKVGERGYFAILGAKGRQRGVYFVSKGGSRDGEDIWDLRDAEGRPFVKEMIDEALRREPGTIRHNRYAWRNLDDRFSWMAKPA